MLTAQQYEKQVINQMFLKYGNANDTEANIWLQQVFGYHVKFSLANIKTFVMMCSSLTGIIINREHYRRKAMMIYWLQEHLYIIKDELADKLIYVRLEDGQVVKLNN